MSAPPPPPIPLEVAQQRLLDLAPALGSELVPTGECLGRYLPSGLTAQRSHPAADLSAMDGYAVSSEAAAETLRVVGESAAGRPFPAAIELGDAVRISTGAIMPAGANAVLLQEDAIREQDRLVAKPGAEPSARHIRRRGFDFQRRDVVLGRGVTIGPVQLALAITAGYGAGKLEVGRLPRVAVIDSGDELAMDLAQCADDQVPASNGIMLQAMVWPLVEECRRIGPVPDRIEDLLAAFSDAGDVDVIVTSGGASVGDHDLVRPALEQWGATIDFWRVAMKPGKPLLVARKGAQIVLGLPGNPVSSYVTAFLFLLPLVRHLAGAAQPLPPFLYRRLEGDLPATGNRAEFVRATLAPAHVTPLVQQDSSALATLARADALIFRDRERPPATSGEVVRVYPLQNGGIA